VDDSAPHALTIGHRIDPFIQCYQLQFGGIATETAGAAYEPNDVRTGPDQPALVKRPGREPATQSIRTRPLLGMLCTMTFEGHHKHLFGVAP
jgi:hypothetical protein